jgi:hypothetical protein
MGVRWGRSVGTLTRGIDRRQTWKRRRHLLGQQPPIRPRGMCGSIRRGDDNLTSRLSRWPIGTTGRPQNKQRPLRAGAAAGSAPRQLGAPQSCKRRGLARLGGSLFCWGLRGKCETPPSASPSAISGRQSLATQRASVVDGAMDRQRRSCRR